VLGSTVLQVSCGCGHSGQVLVADLVARHGRGARVRDVVAGMRCRSCGIQRIQTVRWLGSSSVGAGRSERELQSCP
jgi:metal-dependent hydrolase (beta-lactamase superfamily II)